MAKAKIPTPIVRNLCHLEPSVKLAWTKSGDLETGVHASLADIFLFVVS